MGEEGGDNRHPSSSTFSGRTIKNPVVWYPTGRWTFFLDGWGVYRTWESTHGMSLPWDWTEENFPSLTQKTHPTGLPTRDHLVIEKMGRRRQSFGDVKIDLRSNIKCRRKRLSYRYTDSNWYFKLVVTIYVYIIYYLPMGILLSLGKEWPILMLCYYPRPRRLTWVATFYVKLLLSCRGWGQDQTDGDLTIQSLFI